MAELQAQLAAIQRELGVAAEQEAPPPSVQLAELRKTLKEHRAMMRQGGLIALEDERYEMQLVRAIELAKAPAAAQRGHPDGVERLAGLTNAGLASGVEDGDDAE